MLINPTAIDAMEGHELRTVFTLLITIVILAMAYFYSEQNAFRFLLDTGRPLYSLPAIKAKQSFVASQTGDKAVGKCDKECSRFQDLARNWD